VVTWGVFVVLLQLGLGVLNEVYANQEAITAQGVRVGFAAMMTVLGVALASRRLANEEHLRRVTAIAAVAQRAILRDLPDAVGQWQVASRYRGAAQEARVGGDLYDVLATDRQSVLLLIGDVRGKGLPAVQLASLVLGTFRHPSSRTQRGEDLFAALHTTVEQHATDEDFVTAALVELAVDGTCCVWNAGHPPPLLLRPDGARLLPADTATAPLGLGSGPVRPCVAQGTRLLPTDVLLLYTDGLTEGRRPSDRRMFPLEVRGPELLRHRTLQEGLGALLDALDSWTDGAFTDDVALLAARYRTGAAPGPAAG
jgi:serine phosphatase RsbU (regulator of sigma subunit)